MIKKLEYFSVCINGLVPQIKHAKFDVEVADIFLGILYADDIVLLAETEMASGIC
jgi:hypothetical protein